MNIPEIKLILAEDDPDDRMFFEEALNEISVSAEVTAVKDGEELMHLLSQDDNDKFNVLFLDLNMPRKNGFECLTEMKQNNTLETLPVIILSTTKADEIVNLLYKEGVKYYIQKPGNFPQLRKALDQALKIIKDGNTNQPPRDKFELPID